MSWNSETWAQDDDKNSGFPFIQDSGLASQADFSHSKTIWNFSNVNFQFPYVCTPVPQADFSNSKTIWKFHSSVNFGFPFIVTTEKIPQDTPSFPIFSSFSFSGLGADFKHVSETSAVSLPEEICFRFQKPNALSFQFPKKQEVIL